MVWIASSTTLTCNQDHVLGRVPTADPPADQEAGGASAEGVLQRRPHHPAPARPGGEDCRLVQEPYEEVKTFCQAEISTSNILSKNMYRKAELIMLPVCGKNEIKTAHQPRNCKLWHKVCLFRCICWNSDILMEELKVISIDYSCVDFLCKLVCWHASRLNPPQNRCS